MYNILPEVTDEAIQSAYEIFQGFIDVNQGQEREDKVQALRTHCAGLNLSDEAVENMWDRAEHMFGEAPAGFVFVGILLGLRAVEYALNAS